MEVTSEGTVVVVRRAATLEDLWAIGKVVATVAGYQDIHPAVLVSVLHSGGYVGGAWAGATCVGGLYGLLGRDGEELILHSEMLAVLPEVQNLGIARRLKEDEFAFAWASGLRAVRWTYDPLRARNARLNLERLGARVRRFIPNMYGELPGFSSGWETDQFLVECRAEDASRGGRYLHDPTPDVTMATLPHVMSVKTSLTGVTELVRYDLKIGAPDMFVEIPASIADIRARDMDAAHAWRLGLREVIETYFARGYRVSGYLGPVTRLLRGGYVLTSLNRRA